MIPVEQLQATPESTGQVGVTAPENGGAAAPLITVTPRAISKIREIFAKHQVQGGLRLGVLGGGCSGLSYQFKFDAKERPKDNVLVFDDVKIFVDPKSMIYLKGMTLDYKETLMQSGFAFENPNAKKACGCGTSFTA
jgi:iron-sulfur cluster assembly protein